jgi:hypothetical protein
MFNRKTPHQSSQLGSLPNFATPPIPFKVLNLRKSALKTKIRPPRGHVNNDQCGWKPLPYLQKTKSIQRYINE